MRTYTIGSLATAVALSVVMAACSDMPVADPGGTPIRPTAPDVQHLPPADELRVDANGVDYSVINSIAYPISKSFVYEPAPGADGISGTSDDVVFAAAGYPTFFSFPSPTGNEWQAAGVKFALADGGVAFTAGGYNCFGSQRATPFNNWSGGIEVTFVTPDGQPATVSRYRTGYNSGPPTARVYDKNGTLLATVPTPLDINMPGIAKIVYTGTFWCLSGTATYDGLRPLSSPQSIDFPEISDQEFGAGPLTLSATATSGLTVSFAATGPCTVAGSSLTLTGVGTCEVTATQAGDAVYEAATPVVQSFAIGQAASTVTWTDPAGITYGTALSATQLNATSDQAGSFVYTPASGTVLNAGTHELSVTFTPSDANYAGATNTVSITVAKATPVVSWTTPAGITYGTALSATQLNATSSVPGSMVYTPTAGTVLNAGNGQTLSVSFTPTDADNYNNATGGTTIDVAKAVITATANNGAMIYADPVPTLTSSFSGFVNGEDASVIGGAYQVTTTATSSSPAGTYPITPIVSGLTAANYTFAAVNAVLTVNKRAANSAYTGESYALTGGPKANSVTLRLGAHLTRSGNAGDIALARVNFLLFSPTNTTSTPNQRVDNVVVNASGDASVSAVIQAGTWIVRTEIPSGNGYWKTGDVDEGVVTVAVPTDEQRVTGGGWLSDAQSASGKTHFGITVSTTKQTGTPKGNVTITFAGTDGFDYRAKTNTWNNASVTFAINNNPGRARFTARVNIDKIDRVTGLVVATLSGYTLDAEVLDGNTAKPAAVDRLSLVITSSDGSVWKQLGSVTNMQLLGGGNLDVKSK